MIVEFIGCTGAGKTTLINEVRARLTETVEVVTAHEIIARQVGLGVSYNPTLRNLVEECACLPHFLGSLHRHRAFVALTVRLFARESRLSLAAVSNLRSIVRKIGGYEIARRHDPDAVVLVDEGPAQAAHMFAFNAAPPGPAEVARFAGLLPLPDVFVYVRTPVESLVRRTQDRPDPPRQMLDEPAASTEAHVRAAIAIFDRLAQAESLRGRTVIADNTDCPPQERRMLAEHVAESILSRMTAHREAAAAGHLAHELS
jgi:thymidylate kinase